PPRTRLGTVPGHLRHRRGPSWLLWPWHSGRFRNNLFTSGLSWTRSSASRDRAPNLCVHTVYGVARIPRYVWPDGIFHVTTRGVAKMPIYGDDDDRRVFLGLLGHAGEEYDWTCHTFCLMTNHYHL